MYARLHTPSRHRTRIIYLNELLVRQPSHGPPSLKVVDVCDQAVWCLSSCKNNHGIGELLNDSLETFWQSDGPQPHTVTVLFQRKTTISEICLYNDYKVDESYTPSR